MSGHFYNNSWFFKAQLGNCPDWLLRTVAQGNEAGPTSFNNYYFGAPSSSPPFTTSLTPELVYQARNPTSIYQIDYPNLALHIPVAVTAPFIPATDTYISRFRYVAHSESFSNFVFYIPPPGPKLTYIPEHYLGLSFIQLGGRIY